MNLTIAGRTDSRFEISGRTSKNGLPGTFDIEYYSKSFHGVSKEMCINFTELFYVLGSFLKDRLGIKILYQCIYFYNMV